MIEVVPDFEMPTVKFFVAAKEQDCPQSTSSEAEPPPRVTDSPHGFGRARANAHWRRYPSALRSDLGSMNPDGAGRRIAVVDQNTKALSSFASGPSPRIGRTTWPEA
jgi:hypothetical protein